MKEARAYSHHQWVRAVNLSALLGWLIITAPAFAQSHPALWLWIGGIGLLIAFLVCWAIVAPVLRHLMRRPISWIRAAVWGAGISALIATISIALGRFIGWRQSLNPHFYSRSGGGDYVREIDGILTPYGWLLLAKSTALFVLLGTTIALILRWRIGPGRHPE